MSLALVLGACSGSDSGVAPGDAAVNDAAVDSGPPLSCAEPRLLATLEMVEAAGVAVVGNYAFVGAGTLEVVDVEHPSAPVVVDSVDVPVDPSGGLEGGSGGVSASGTVLVTTGGGIGAAFFDITDPANASYEGAEPISFRDGHEEWILLGAAVSGGQAFLTRRRYVAGEVLTRVDILDVSDVSSRILVNQTTIDDGGELSVFVTDTRLFAADLGHLIAYTRVGADLEPLGIFRTGGKPYIWLSAWDELAFAGTDDFLAVVDSTTPGEPSVVTAGFGDREDSTPLSLGTNGVVAATYVSGLDGKLIDVRNPSRPRLVTDLPYIGYATDFVVTETLILAVSQYQGLSVMGFECREL